MYHMTINKKIIIQTVIKPEDYQDFHSYVVKKISSEKPLNLLSNVFGVLYWALVAITVISLLSFYETVPWSTYERIDTITISLAFLFIITIIYSKLFRKIYIKKSIYKDSTTLGEHLVEFDDEYIITKHKYFESTISWAAVRYTIDLKNVLYIFLDASKAIIIPKHCLKDEQYNKLLAILKIKKVL